MKKPPPNVKSSSYGTHLVLERELRWGAQYFCSICETHTFVEDRKLNAWTIPDRLLGAVDRWNRGPLRPTSEQWKVLHAIGARPYISYMSEPFRPTYWVPCKVIKHNGKVVDPAWVVFQDHPPVEDVPDRKKFDFVDEIAKVEPSEYALSRKIIIATQNAVDLTGHGTFRTLVADRRDGRQFSLVGKPDFLKMKDYKGSNMVFPPKNTFRPFKEYEEPSAKIPAFIADVSLKDAKLVISELIVKSKQTRR